MSEAFYNGFEYGMPPSILVSQTDDVVVEDASDTQDEDEVPALFRDAELQFDSLPTLSDDDVGSQELFQMRFLIKILPTLTLVT